MDESVGVLGEGASVPLLGLLSLESRAWVWPRLSLELLPWSCTDLLGGSRGRAWVWAARITLVGGSVVTHSGHCHYSKPRPGSHTRCAVALAGGDISYVPILVLLPTWRVGWGADEKVGVTGLRVEAKGLCESVVSLRRTRGFLGKVLGHVPVRLENDSIMTPTTH